MSATDELRRMLDERGVEHFDGTETTLWGYEPTSESTGAYRFAADETIGGRMQVRMFNLAPEQAIEATLGRGTCYNTWLVELTGRLRFQCSECKAVSLEITPVYCPVCGAKVVEE